MNRLIGVDKENGSRVGAIPGNENFRLRGKPNELSDVGKAVLERMQSGKYTKTVKPFSRLIFRDEHARCLREGILFEDPEFPVNDTSVYYRAKPNDAIVWKRPGEMAPEPRFIAGGHSRFDVNQGKLGDCWLLAAAADLTLRDDLFYRVVPPDQDFTKEKYAGIFHFRFWRYGEWVDVVVDDRLPYCMYEDGSIKLYGVCSTDKNEFWSALLEKAYAKMHGTYEHLNGGLTNNALVDFTGGIPQFHVNIRDSSKPEVIKFLSRDLKNAFYGTAFFKYRNVSDTMETIGLVDEHAYSVTGLAQLNDGQLVLVRLRNPWGRYVNEKKKEIESVEWNGRYSDNSPEWNNVPEDKRKSLRQECKDGEFWMHIDDFIKHFQWIDECHLPLHELKEVELMTGIPQPQNNVPVFGVSEHGSWSYKDRKTRKRCYPTMGKDNKEIKCTDQKGCLLACPQYLVTVGTGTAGQQKELLVIALQQKYRQELRHKGLQDLQLGISIFKAPKGTNSRVDQTFIQQNSVTTELSTHEVREALMGVQVDPGDYIIIPFKMECYWDGEFFMRMFSNAQLQSRLLK